MKTKALFSPNFNKKKRSKKSINMIIIHYTGMQSERESLKRLTDLKFKVSCHYFINKRGEVFNMVNEANIAWHAGLSCWSKKKNLNKNSIGIELENKGHQFGYTNFKKKQIKKLIILSKILIKKYKIAPKNVIGHSDIAPTRKKDPGEKFPWELLSKKKIGLWHNLNSNFLKKLKKKRIRTRQDKKIFISCLSKIGYCIYPKISSLIYSKTVKSFQRHFRQDIVDGKLDQECLIIASNLVKKL